MLTEWTLLCPARRPATMSRREQKIPNHMFTERQSSGDDALLSIHPSGVTFVITATGGVETRLLLGNIIFKQTL